MQMSMVLFMAAGLAWAADDAAVMAFTQRVDQFAKIRDAANRKVGAMPKAATPEQIEAQEKKLLVEILSSRTNAKQGDIFSPDIEPLFRKILKANFTGSEKKENRETARQGNPGNDADNKGEAAPAIAVNAAYPKSASLSSVPPLLLLELPKLPKDIEYRFVGQTLILWDNVSNIILDFMKGAAPGL